jgi:HAD superfamily hydrolase (TIGR01509 family)
MIVHLPFDAVLFDLDGTLIDSNAAHATSWLRALAEHGFDVDIMTVRAVIGMGADKLLPAVAGVTEDSPVGRAVAARKQELFSGQLPWLRPMPGARALLQYLLDRGTDVVIATSAGEQEMTALLERAGIADLACKRASKDDAAESKPDPDIVCAAMARTTAGPEATVMVGDTPYDLEAAARAGIPSIALRCGGHWTDHHLRAALYIFDDPQELLDRWRRSAGSATAYRRGA